MAIFGRRFPIRGITINRAKISAGPPVAAKPRVVSFAAVRYNPKLVAFRPLHPITIKTFLRVFVAPKMAGRVFIVSFVATRYSPGLLPFNPIHKAVQTKNNKPQPPPKPFKSSHNRTLLQRDPTQLQPLRRFTEILADMINSLVGQGQIVQTGPSSWTIATLGMEILVSLGPQVANTVLAGPTSGPPAVATFRPLVGADMIFDTAANLFIGGGGLLAAKDGPGFSGCDNIGIGGQSYDTNVVTPALAAVTSGSSNLAIGPGALGNLTTSGFNIALGESAGSNLTTGDSNVLIGPTAGFNLTTGSENVFIGDATGFNLFTGSGNTFIGTFATSSADVNSSIGLGNVTVTNSNQCQFGGAAGSGNEVVLIWGGHTAPADADLLPGQCAIYFDFTNGAPLMKAKGKTLDGTVYNKTITWV